MSKAIAVLLLFPALLRAQAFDPFPNGSAPRYQFDLRAFFATPGAEAIARDSLIKGAQQFGAARDSIASAMRRSPDALARAITIADSLQRRAGRHYAYSWLANYIDSRVTTSPGVRQLASTVGRSLGFVTPTLISIPDSQIRSWLQTSSALTPWRFMIEQSRDSANRVAQDSAGFAAANAAAPRLAGWQASAFQGVLASIVYAPVNTPSGPKDVRSQGSVLMNDSSRTVREQWYRSNRTGMASKRDTLAALLTSIINGRNEIARMRHYSDFRDESYRGSFLSTSAVRAMLDQLAASSAVNKHYEQLRIDRLKKEMRFDSVHTWDLVLPERGMTTPQFTITQATAAMLAATRPFGPDYAREMGALLDPANGRLDLFPRPNRVDRPGFSTGSVGYPSTFFQGRYAGYVEDVVVFVHEAGHAVQNMLMDQHRVPLAYALGPPYFTESFAAFNELLITDYLYRTATDKPHRIFYLQRFLDQATELFKGAREARVEDEFYATITPSRPWSADLFEGIEQQIGARYSNWFGPASERPMEWVNAIHFFTRPLYRVNYVYAKLLALNYFDRMSANASDFAPKYVALLSNGYNATPNDLLKRFVGMSLDDSDFISRALRVISSKTQELETLSR